MADVLLFHTPEGGEIEVSSARVRMIEDVRTAVYLSLFGGNKRDDGSSATAHLQWWGNHAEREQVRRYRSETQATLEALPLIPANLRRIEDSVLRDLAWMEDQLGARVSAVATIPTVNKVRLRINVEIDGEVFPFTFEYFKDRDE